MENHSDSAVKDLNYLGINRKNHRRNESLEEYIRIQYSGPGLDASYNIRLKYELREKLGELGPIVDLAMKSSTITLLVKHFESNVHSVRKHCIGNINNFRRLMTLFE